MPKRNLLNVALLYATALASGYAMYLLRVPLPWMIGPMVLAAIVSLAGKKPVIPWIARPIGQLSRCNSGTGAELHIGSQRRSAEGV